MLQICSLNPSTNLTVIHCRKGQSLNLGYLRKSLFRLITFTASLGVIVNIMNISCKQCQAVHRVYTPIRDVPYYRIIPIPIESTISTIDYREVGVCSVIHYTNLLKYPISSGIQCILYRYIANNSN